MNRERDASVRPGAWRAAAVVIISGAAILLCGKHVVGEMISKTRGVGWETPAESTSLVAANHAAEFFPGRMQGAIVIAVEALEETPTVLTEVVAEFSRNVRDRVAQDERVQPFKPMVIGYFLNVSGGHHINKVMQHEVVSPDQRMTLIIIQPTVMAGQLPEANAFLQEFCASPPPGYTLHITGMPSVGSRDGCFAGVHATAKKDMNVETLFRAELFTIPVAILVVAYNVTYVRLLVLPVLALIVSFIIASAFLIPWMDSVSVPTDAPALMGSLTIAGSIDYSLFMLSRFSEHHMEFWTLQRNVDMLMDSTSRTILVSGSLIAIAFFGSIVMPERNLQATGMCMGLVTIATVVVNITLTPALLLAGGKLWTGGGTLRQLWARDVRMRPLFAAGDAIDPSERSVEPNPGLWVKAMRMVHRCPYSSVAMVLLLMSPILVHLPELNISGDRFSLVPMDMPAMMALRRVQESFPVGFLDPYAVVITAPMQGTLESEKVLAGERAFVRHEVTQIAKTYGLSREEAVTTAEVVVNISRGHSMGPAFLDMVVKELHVDSSTLAALSVGSASVAAKYHGGSDEDALKAAVRAAKETRCATADIEEAMRGAAAVLYANRTHAPTEAGEAVRTEAMKLGYSQAAATRIAAAVVPGAHRTVVHQSTLAAVRVGVAAQMGKVQNKSDIVTLKDSLHALDGLDLSTAEVTDVMHAAAGFIHTRTNPRRLSVNIHREKAVKTISHEMQLTPEKMSHEIQAEAVSQGLSHHTAELIGAAVKARTHEVDKALDEDAPLSDDLRKAVSTVAGSGEEVADKSAKWRSMLDMVDYVQKKVNVADHGVLLMPSGYAAMLDLCERLQDSGSVASMVGPTWGFKQRIEWVSLVAMHMNSTIRQVYSPLLESHVNGNRALLEVHTTFPSIGAGGVDWVLAVREELAAWELSHPGFKAELAGGASEAADTRGKILDSMWSYLGIIVTLIMAVVSISFRSIMVPLRLALALFFTLAGTFSVAVVVYQTPLLHGLFPCLKHFHGLTFEVVPIATGVAIALGLDYDILLVSRIVEFRMQSFSDSASIFRGASKAGGIITGAGLIMALAFSGLLFSNKLLFQQFGVLLITSVLLDTFVVRTVLVPALMLMAQGHNWWPRKMPPVFHESLEGEVDFANAGATSDCSPMTSPSMAPLQARGNVELDLEGM